MLNTVFLNRIKNSNFKLTVSSIIKINKLSEILLYSKFRSALYHSKISASGVKISKFWFATSVANERLYMFIYTAQFTVYLPGKQNFSSIVHQYLAFILSILFKITQMQVVLTKAPSQNPVNN